MPDKKLNILLVVRWPVGGIRTYLRYVYNNFDPEHYSISLIAPDIAENTLLLNDLCLHNIKYIALDENPTNVDIIKSILFALKNDKYDIIHSHGLTAGFCSVFPSLLYTTPHLLTIHDLYLDNQLKGVVGVVKKIVFTSLLLLIDIIHTVSNDSSAYLTSKLPILSIFKNKLVTIQNGIECERFYTPEVRDLRNELNLSENMFLIGFLGRFMSPKGFVYLVDALDILYEKYKLPIKPIVITFGEGAFIREENIYVNKKGLGEKIFFMPFTPDVASTLKGLDVIVMPSLWEACPLLPMEAMVAGVPLIGTNCVGLREILDETPCKTVPVRNSEALAEAIMHEITNPSKIQAEQYRHKAMERFDVKKHSKKLSETINLLVSRNIKCAES